MAGSSDQVLMYSGMFAIDVLDADSRAVLLFISHATSEMKKNCGHVAESGKEAVDDREKVLKETLNNYDRENFLDFCHVA